MVSTKIPRRLHNAINAAYFMQLQHYLSSRLETMSRNDELITEPCNPPIGGSPTQSYEFSLVLYNITLELQCTLTKQGLQCEWGLSIVEDAPPSGDALAQILRRCRLVC